VIVPTHTTELLNSERLGTLHTLVAVTLKWVDQQIDDCCKSIKEELEKRSFAELSALPPLEGQLPKLSDIAKRRK
jgi:hypothetical protein